MKPIASPTVLMLASSSSGMATPNLSSTAVAISTIDRESTSRSSVNDFSGVASAGVTPATSSRISARPVWMSSRLTRGPLSRVGRWDTTGVPPMSGTVGPGARGGEASSRQDDDLAGEREAGAVAEEQRDVAGLRLAALLQRRQRQGHRRRRGVAGSHDVAGDHGALGQVQPLGHQLDDAEVRLVRGEDVDVVGADAGPAHGLLEGGGELRGGPAVHRLAGHAHALLAQRDGDRLVQVAVAAPDHGP